MKRVTFNYVTRPVAEPVVVFIQLSTEGHAFGEPTIHKFESIKHATMSAQVVANTLDVKVRLTYKTELMEFGEPLKEYVSRLNGSYFTPENQF